MIFIRCIRSLDGLRVEMFNLKTIKTAEDDAGGPGWLTTGKTDCGKPFYREWTKMTQYRTRAAENFPEN